MFFAAMFLIVVLIFVALLLYTAIFTNGILWVSVVLIAFLSLPYVVMLVKRVLFARQLACLCRRCGYSFEVTSPLWFLSGIRATRPAFYVETPSTVYSVKLFGTVFRHHFINFIDAGHYLVCNIAPIMVFLTPAPPKRRTKPPCDFRYLWRERYSGKVFEPILLMFPVPATVSSGGRLIGNGDFVHEGRFYTKSAFLKMLGSMS